MNRAKTLWVMLAVGLVTAGAALASSLKIELPGETATLKPGAGSEATNGQCLTCHSAEYITTQPRDKPLAFWRAEVEKMKKVYGAPVPDDQIGTIADYLARSYGTGGS
jgi:sulfite dehydrogenase (cytochrome) subunit B